MKMKNFLIYLSGALYSVSECLKTWKKPKKYPVLVFIFSFIMLLTPIQNNMLSTPKETVLNQIPNIQIVLRDLAIELNENNIQVNIKDNKLNCTSTYEGVIDNFYVYVGKDLQEYPEVNKTTKGEKDNLLVLGTNRFYARYVDRTELDTENGISVLSGYYNKINNFDFKYFLT